MMEARPPGAQAFVRHNAAILWPFRERLVQPIVLIPARMESTRLPGKPLADIAGEPMIPEFERWNLRRFKDGKLLAEGMIIG